MMQNIEAKFFNQIPKMVEVSFEILFDFINFPDLWANQTQVSSHIEYLVSDDCKIFCMNC